MIIKFLALADTHQSKEKWRQLVQAVQQVRPDVVAIAGDLLPRDNGILAQTALLPYLKDCAAEIRDAGAELVLILGNDDNRLVVPAIEEGDAQGLWHYVADRVKEVRGFEFCGCPWMRDFPFAYKYWVAPGTAEELFINHFQLGPPLSINENNEIEPISDFEGYLKGKRSVAESLESMAKQVKNIARSVWLIHDPPAYLNLDLCASGDMVGSAVVYRFLKEKQPLLSIHGHIHEAPKYNGAVWCGTIGATLCIQAGQLDDALYYTTFEIRDGRIENLAHSVYGVSTCL